MSGKRRSRYFHGSAADTLRNRQPAPLCKHRAGNRGDHRGATGYGKLSRCGSALARRDGRYGVFTGCTAFPRCRYPAPSRAALARQPSARHGAPHRDGDATTVRVWCSAAAAAQQEAARAALARSHASAARRAARRLGEPAVGGLRARAARFPRGVARAAGRASAAGAGGHARLLPAAADGAGASPAPTLCSRACRRALAARSCPSNARRCDGLRRLGRPRAARRRDGAGQDAAGARGGRRAARRRCSSSRRRRSG